METKNVQVSAPFKALMLFDSAQDADKNFRHSDVYLHTSVEGVRRLTFTEYMNLLSEPHNGRYQLERFYPKDEKTNDELIAADIKLVKTAPSEQMGCIKDEKHKVRIEMAFRHIWYMATGEILPTI